MIIRYTVLASILALSMPEYAMASKKALTATDSLGTIFVVPQNMIFMSRLTRFDDITAGQAKAPEFRAVLFRKSARFCYQMKMTGFEAGSLVEMGPGLPGHDDRPLLALSVLDGTSGTCAKLPRRFVYDLSAKRVTIYVRITSPSHSRVAARGQLYSEVQDIAVDDMQSAFSLPIKDEVKEFPVLSLGLSTATPSFISQGETIFKR